MLILSLRPRKLVMLFRLTHSLGGLRAHLLGIDWLEAGSLGYSLCQVIVLLR